ncbi:MAG: alpha/beta hydrolase [Gordonia sp. (in: high G+C Gram-positive bacteria)]
MRPLISALRGWDIESISAAGDAAQAAADAIDSALTAMTNAMDYPSHWSGKTHDAVVHRVTDERDHADEIRNVLQQIADEATDAASALAYARAFTLREVDFARQYGFAVSDTGEVTSDEHPDEKTGISQRRAEEAVTLQARIHNGLDTIDEYDIRFGTALEALRTDLAAMINGHPEVIAPDGNRRDPDDVVTMLTQMSADERRAFLDRLSPQDQRRIMQADPDTIGNLNGVPFPIRIDANEINIRNAINDEEHKHTAAGDKRAAVLRDLLRRRSDPLRVPKGTSPDAIPAGLDADDLMVERQFISFRNTPNGQIVEMIGNIHRNTRNAAVYIPGTGTNLNNSRSNYDSAWNLAHDSASPVFIYMEGDLPQNLGIEEPARRLFSSIIGDQNSTPHDLSDSAVNRRFAQEMAPRLVQFGHELDTELGHIAPESKTTYIGHSYGGSVLGSAEQLGLRADRVVYASSAGTGIFDGAWNNANPNVERFSMTAPADPIQIIQDLPGNPHGSDPDDAPGVTRLATGSYSGQTPEHSGLVAGPGGHGGYWDDPGSTAFRNLVAVVRGDTPVPAR